jgi:putative SOS response-associated peptidase YedK
MCGRIIQSGGPLRYAIVDGMNMRDSRVHNYPPRWNGAPSQELLVIRRNHKTGEVSLDSLRWGLIPYWCKDPSGGRKPINAKCETVRDLPTFRDAYRTRRCIVPVDGFFEWKANKGHKAKQPYAIAMKDGAPFGIAGIWENWKEPASGEWNRTFAIITTDANELVAAIHDRMPVILAPSDYDRWLGEEPDPGGLMRQFPADLMRMWPISTRVNKPENDDPSIVDPIESATDVAYGKWQPAPSLLASALLCSPSRRFARDDSLVDSEVFEFGTFFQFFTQPNGLGASSCPGVSLLVAVFDCDLATF